MQWEQQKVLGAAHSVYEVINFKATGTSGYFISMSVGNAFFRIEQIGKSNEHVTYCSYG